MDDASRARVEAMERNAIAKVLTRYRYTDLIKLILILHIEYRYKKQKHQLGQRISLNGLHMFLRYVSIYLMFTLCTKRLQLLVNERSRNNLLREVFCYVTVTKCSGTLWRSSPYICIYLISNSSMFYIIL